ncbi:Lipase 2, partial [Termitomyces sp. T112]
LNSVELSTELFPFDPTLDGPDGLLPDIPSKLFSEGQFARVPFITGTNLDEGTLFTSPTINSEQQVRNSIIANFSPPIVSVRELNDTSNMLLKLYPDIPALGSPFNTGNQTFGLSSVFKQAAAIDGDLSFQSQRRNFNEVAAKAGLKTYGYLFTEPQPGSGQLG